MFRSKIEFRVTAQCKRGCSFCLGINRYIPSAPLVDKEILKRRIDQLPKDDSYISVIGGEPLLHPDLPEIVEYLFLKGREVVITTGGLPEEMNPAMVHVLNKLSVHWCLTLHPPFLQDLLRLLQIVELKSKTPLALNYYHKQSFLVMKQVFLEKVVPSLSASTETVEAFEAFCQHALSNIERIESDRTNNRQVFYQDDYRFNRSFGSYVYPWFMPIDGRVARPYSKEKYEDYTPEILECNLLNGMDEFTVREKGDVIPCCAPSQNLAGLVSENLEKEKKPEELLQRRKVFRKKLQAEIEKECHKRGVPLLSHGAIYHWVCGEVCNKLKILS